MTWSYSGSPGDSDVDEIRFWAQLTDEDDPLLTNEEITFIRTIEANNIASAARCCETLANKFAREADIRTGASGEFSLKASQLSVQFAARGKDLRKEAIKYASPWAGSISIDDKQTQEDDTDRVKPAFKRDQFDDPQVNASSISDWDNEGPI